ncbi:N,N'-diacetylbacillosaminyl-diphospho-undecaprenol alpha-1,3-N-acetylgalactosaminyltransferase [compost metagenome]
MKKKFLIVTTVSDSLPFFKGQLNVLKESFEIELVSSSGPHLDEMCALHAVAGHQIEMNREISIFADFMSLMKLTILFIKTKPFVVHGNTPKAGLLSMIAAWIARVPKRIYYVHGLRYHGESGTKKKILMQMEKISCVFATNVIAVSEGVKKVLTEDKVCKKEIQIIWNGSINGLDVAYFSPDIVDTSHVMDEFGIENNNFVFGFIGRLVGDKGINELVSAFKKINATNTKTKLLLVGRFENDLDPLKAETLLEIQNNKNIIHAGFQKDVRPFFKAMNVFVFPSYREGFGIVLMEAGAMNVPAISSNIIGCNEIIRDNHNGFLIESRNENELSEKMKFCVGNPEILSNMAGQSRSLVLEKFEQQLLWKKSLEAYQDICKK